MNSIWITHRHSSFWIIFEISLPVSVQYYFVLFCTPWCAFASVLVSNIQKRKTSEINKKSSSWVVVELLTPLLLPQTTVIYFVFRNTEPFNNSGEATLWNKWHIGQHNMFTSVLGWQDTSGIARNVPPNILATVPHGTVTSILNPLCLVAQPPTNSYINLLQLVFWRPGMHGVVQS